MTTLQSNAIILKLRQIETAAQIIREVHDVRVAAEIAAWMESKAESLAEAIETTSQYDRYKDQQV